LSAKTVLAGGGALKYFQPSFWKSALPPGARRRLDLNPAPLFQQSQSHIDRRERLPAVIPHASASLTALELSNTT
jgi:hypothetical protein